MSVSLGLSLVFAFSSLAANAQIANFSDIVRGTAQSASYCSKVESDVCLMTQANAIAYCASVQSHLPSPRELSQISIASGALGVRSGCTKADLTCDPVAAVKRSTTQVDTFWFDYAGYQRPAGELGDYIFFSAWVSSGGVSWDAFALNGRTGAIEFRHYLEPSAVRCVSGL